MKTPEKNILYQIWNIFKDKAPIGKRRPFWGEAMYVSLWKRKIEIGSIVSELNPKLWKNGGFAPNAIAPVTLSRPVVPSSSDL